jgi:subfamily B ATP-binding cassette protein MsbA
MTSSSPTSQKLTNPWHIYWQLLRYGQRYWLALLIALLASACYSGIDAWFVYFLEPLLNKGLIAKNQDFLHLAPMLVMLVFCCRGCASFLAGYNIAAVSRNIILQLRQDMFAHLQKLPAKFYDQHTPGYLVSLLLYNVEQVANASADTLTSAVQSCCLIVGLLVLMFSISWKLTILYLIIAPSIAVLMRITSTRIRQLSAAIQDSVAKLNHLLEENIKGYKTIRAFNGEQYEQQQFNRALLVNKQCEMKVIIARGCSVAGVQIIAAMALAGTLYLATLAISHSILSTGGFIAIIAAMLAIIKPLKDLTQLQNKLHRGLAGAQSAFAFLQQPTETDSAPRSVSKLHAVTGNISFKQVNFAYASNKPVLVDINLNINAGEMVALVGRSGSGKSTLVNLLPRFYNGYQGEILLDDLPIEEYPLAKLRQQFAIVEQQIFLFNASIANNIAYGCCNVTEGDIIAAATAANAIEFIAKLPQGFATIIGNNGLLLSGGQRQRLAIARAMLKQAPIIILDEATSSLDSESEHYIQEALQKLTANRTTIVIAHRLATIQHAQKIVLFDHGKIVSIGNHQELIRDNSFYKKLCKWQFKTN